jgi:hypothetical protein
LPYFYTSVLREGKVLADIIHMGNWFIYEASVYLQYKLTNDLMRADAFWLSDNSTCCGSSICLNSSIRPGGPTPKNRLLVVYVSWRVESFFYRDSFQILPLLIIYGYNWEPNLDIAKLLLFIQRFKTI